ncbi:MAG: 50S ribosomal protein L15 [Candidatus Margulisbacteria bacterium]|nr:50S ribosomal protein L15 [Candidatus Margulisiibacteriota bacterium]
MQTLKDLKPKANSRSNRKRVARGESSGWGKTAGRGHKGQQSRSGGGFYVGFEGGQTPLYRRLPKLKGFTNFFRKHYAVINLEQLNTLEEKVITPELLKEKGLIRKSGDLLKILGDGKYTQTATIKAHRFSTTAEEKIKKAGGKIEVIPMSVAAKAKTKSSVKISKKGNK